MRLAIRTLFFSTFLLIALPSRAEDPAALAVKAHAILKANCHRCHGQDGALEGGMNYVLDRDKLIARKKIVPGKPDASPLYQRIARGKMPPEGETPRPTKEEVALLEQWIKAGAPAPGAIARRAPITESAVFDTILADLEKMERRGRRFARYFNLAPIANTGAGADELQSYRNALAKLMNSLSWHPRITLPQAVDKDGLVLRIDLRDFVWDANSWNRLLNEYPYGILQDTSAGRAVMVYTATRMPVVRLDWFVANASRPPLYYDLLQIPSNLTVLEQQLRVDPAADILQERVARAGFIGSGISKNNRLLERHDSVHGYYWRTYDFDAIPQNLTERDNLLPDRRNLFAYPLGPGGTENLFQHAGGEVIFSLPNGLQGYLLVNANNTRLDKGPTAIVSDPKRPDRAVEAGVSCINCHNGGIIPKADQIRPHVEKNAKHFNKTTRELVRALYLPEKKTKGLMDEDAERFRKALTKTGNKVSAFEVVMSVTLRHEADVDLPELAAEVGLRPDDLLARLKASAVLSRSLGALRIQGATVARQTIVQSFGDLVRELRLGGVLQPGNSGTPLPDATGEIDPLEAQSSPANAVAFSPDGRLAAIASADKSVRIWDVEGGRDLRRCIGHTASVWSVAFSSDGTRILSGSKDGTVRLWDVETARELKRMEGHDDLVTAVAFSPDGRRALSLSFDQEAILWDLDRGETISTFHGSGIGRYLNAVAFAPNGERALVCADRNVLVIDAATGKVIHTLTGHTAPVVSAVFSADGEHILSGGDDRTLRLWDANGKLLRTMTGHDSWVKCVVLSPDGKRALSGSTDATVRLWELDSGKEVKVFRKHAEPLVAVTFLGKGRQTLSTSRDGNVQLWTLDKVQSTNPDPPSDPGPSGGELKPRKMIAVGGTIGALHLSPDGKKLFYLNLTANKLARVDVTTDHRDKAVALVDGTDASSLSRDGKLLATLSATGKGRSRLQIIDPATLEVRKTHDVALHAYDLAAGDGVVYLSGAGNDWTDVTAIDAVRGTVVGRWGGVWNRSFVQLSTDGKRIYHASQGVTPGTLEALVFPAKPDDKPETRKASVPNGHALGGEFLLSPDGRFLLCRTGTVLRTSAERGEDLQFHAAIGPFVAAAIDPESRAAVVLTRDGLLKYYSYPDFKLKVTHSLGLVSTGVAVAGKQGKVYVAGFDPRTVGDRPRVRGYGDLFVFDLKDIVSRSGR
jgi:WD40 repeat protein/mono/diheme cytochrome c family protein